MAMNVVATTSSALAAGMLRFELAGRRLTSANSPAVTGRDEATGSGSESDGESPLSTYDVRGRVASSAPSDEMVNAVGDLLAAKSDVVVDAAVIKRVYDMQGSLLNVFA